jgi:hypothetical protein
MKRLARPAAVYEDDLRAMVRPAERIKHAQAIKAAIKQAGRYAKKSPDLGQVSTIFKDATKRKFFLALYSRKGAVAIKKRISSNLVGTAVCQYCGISTARTFDHFLEKAKIPELSVYAPNLVPCCGDCNLLRGDTFGVAKERRVLHYFDDPVDKLPSLLVAMVRFDAGVPVIDYYVASSGHALAAIFRRQFEALRLAQRLKERAQQHLNEWRPRVRRLSDAQVRKVCQKEANDLEETRGKNDYEVAFLRSIVASQEIRVWLMKEK